MKGLDGMRGGTVVDTVTGSTVPRRQLGRHLRDARGLARLTVRAAVEALEWSDTKIWRIETGQTAMRSHDVQIMCRIYGASVELTEALAGLAKETKSRGWWHAYGDVIPDYFDLYIGLEAAASELCIYESELVPGLLQTADYTRTIITTYEPELAPEEIERRVELRRARQALLTRITARPVVTVVLNEAVLRRLVGSRRMMLGQCRQLLHLAEHPNVSLSIVPFSIGLHRGVTARPFTLLRFPRNSDGKESEPSVIYIEGLTGALYLDRPREVEMHEAAFSRILHEINDASGSVSRRVLHMAIRELDR
jgi:hypothetical protein